MNEKNKDILLNLIAQHNELGISEQIDYNKFYLYSIITHSTAIEGSTVTEVEAQLLFDEGITSSKRTMIEQMMNLDLKAAYDYGMQWISGHEDITVDWLIYLSSKVMARTGNEYKSLGGDFSAAKGELRKLNVTAGAGGRSYMHYQKVPMKLEAFCKELNERRKHIDTNNVAAIYELSFWAHYELVTIHPWADGNGRMSRLLMNLLQMEYGVLPTKVLKEYKAEYIQALIDTREEEDIEIFIDCMTRLHCQHLKSDIDNFITSTQEEIGDKSLFRDKIVDKINETGDKLSVKVNVIDNLAIILSYIDAHPHTKTDTLVKLIGKSPSTIKHYLSQLVALELLEAEGANKNRTYVTK